MSLSLWCTGQYLKFHANYMQTMSDFFSKSNFFISERNSNNYDNRLPWESSFLALNIRNNMIFCLLSYYTSLQPYCLHCSTFTFVHNWFWLWRFCWLPLFEFVYVATDVSCVGETMKKRFVHIKCLFSSSRLFGFCFILPTVVSFHWCFCRRRCYCCEYLAIILFECMLVEICR